VKKPLEASYIKRLGPEGWLEQKAKQNPNIRILKNKVKICIRPFTSFNGDAKYYLLNNLSKKEVELFSQAHGGTDVVDILGTSIAGKSRKEIIKMGPEFFLITEKKTIEVLPEYDEFQTTKLDKFSSTFREELVSYIQKMFTGLKTQEHVQKFYNNINEVLTILFNNVIGNTGVVYMNGDQRIKKNFNDFHRVMKAKVNEPIGKPIGSQITDDFPKEHIVKGLMKTVGNDVKNFMREFPVIFRQSYKNNTEEKADHLIGKKIEDVISMKKGNETLFLMNLSKNEPDIGAPIQQRSYRRIPVKRSKRFRIFDGLDLDIPCLHCNSTECEKGRNKKSGFLLKKANVSLRECPVDIAERRIGTDIELKKTAMTLQSKLSKKKKDGPMAVLLIRSGVSFNPKTDCGAIIVEKKDGLPSIIKTGIGTEYIVNNNKLVNQQEEIDCVLEYHDPERYKNLLFLIEK